MNKLATSKEHIESMSRFCVVLANVNKSEMQRDKNRSSQSLAKFIMGRTCHRQYMAKWSAFFVCFRQTTHSIKRMQFLLLKMDLFTIFYYLQGDKK